MSSHRLLGIVLTPFFTHLGYLTKIEMDLSTKEQLIDIIVVRRTSMPVKESGLPAVYWEAFDELNEHNLISFKSYSESFNILALLELFGHLASYHKTFNIPLDKINLYAITHHYPRLILGPFAKTKFLTIVKEKEIFDLKLGNYPRLRVVVVRQTDNPILALFSGNWEKVEAAYGQLKKETELLSSISSYFYKITEYYKKEFSDMYTEQDFWRDNPSPSDPFVFPWERDYHQQQVEKAEMDGIEEGIEKGKLEIARAMLAKGMEISFISEITGLKDSQIMAKSESNGSQ